MWLRVKRWAAFGTGHRQTGSVGPRACPPPPTPSAQGMRSNPKGLIAACLQIWQTLTAHPPACDWAHTWRCVVLRVLNVQITNGLAAGGSLADLGAPLSPDLHVRLQSQRPPPGQKPKSPRPGPDGDRLFLSLTEFVDTKSPADEPLALATDLLHALVTGLPVDCQGPVLRALLLEDPPSPSHTAILTSLLTVFQSPVRMQALAEAKDALQVWGWRWTCRQRPPGQT